MLAFLWKQARKPAPCQQLLLPPPRSPRCCVHQHPPAEPGAQRATRPRLPAALARRLPAPIDPHSGLRLHQRRRSKAKPWRDVSQTQCGLPFAAAPAPCLASRRGRVGPEIAMWHQQFWGALCTSETQCTTRKIRGCLRQTPQLCCQRRMDLAAMLTLARRWESSGRQASVSLRSATAANVCGHPNVEPRAPARSAAKRLRDARTTSALRQVCWNESVAEPDVLVGW